MSANQKKTGNSKNVSASTFASEQEILKIASKYTLDNYRRPLVRTEEFQKTLLAKCGGAPIVLDAGCGVGESSWKLGERFPNHFVLGVDKSADRIYRRNVFKQKMPENALLLQADLQDVWPLLYELKAAGKIQVEKQFILYPNPWPKKKALKRRWYANPILPFILNLSSSIELRSNWKTYLEDFEAVFQHCSKGFSTLKEFSPEDPLTPFEKKYFLSQQKLYQLKLEKDES